MGKTKVAPLWYWLWRKWEELLFSCRTSSYSCTSSGLKSTGVNSHGHLYCLKKSIKDSIIAEVKAHLSCWDFADAFDCDLELTKFAHPHRVSSCPSQASQRVTKCLHGKKLSRILMSPYPQGHRCPRDNFETSHVNGSLWFTKKRV